MLKRLVAPGLVIGLIGSGGCLSLRNMVPGGLTAVEATAPEKLELPPKEGAKACVATAEMLEKEGKLFEAAALYERARGLDSAYETLTRKLAVLYDCQGAFGQADAEYQRALEQSPANADLWNDYGYSHYIRGNWAQAEAALRKSLAIKQDHKRAWTNLGLVLVQSGRVDESYDAFTKVVPPAQAHCNLGFALAAKGEKGEAIHQYRIALELAPDLQLAQAAIVKLQTSPGPKPKAGPTMATVHDERSRRQAPDPSPLEPFQVP
jgi:tetratricopeptide (TPR) repeat protein